MCQSAFDKAESLTVKSVGNKVNVIMIEYKTLSVF